MQVQVIDNVLKLNDEVAAMNRQTLHEAGVLTLNLIGGPGSGKTTLLEATLRHMALEGERDRLRLGICVGDLATTRDADRLHRWCDQVVQVNTGKGCHLDANQVRQAIARLDLSALDILVIENVGNLICPVGFDLGEDFKVGLFSTTEGDDKPAKHPHLLAAAHVLLLNKIDLLPYVSFNLEHFHDDVRRLNPYAVVLPVAAEQDEIGPWLKWLRVCKATPPRHQQ